MLRSPTNGNFTKQRAIRPLILLLVSCVATGAQAENIWYDGVLHNARATFDFSSRSTFADGSIRSLNAIGLDFHKVFSRPDGDIGTLTFQPYLKRLDAWRTSSNRGSGTSRQELDWRFSNFNLKANPSGALRFRLGHFEVPFGAEQIIPTNGTLLATNAFANTGLKSDWGISVNGVASNLEYELAWMRGGGNNIRSKADGYLVGRIGLNHDYGGWIGLSVIDGEMEGSQGLVERSRVGFDAGWRFIQGIHVLIDHSIGQENQESAWDLLLELGYTSRSERLFTYLQWRAGNELETLERRDQPGVVFGIRFDASARWSFSLEHNQPGNNSNNTSSSALQLRFRT